MHRFVLAGSNLAAVHTLDLLLEAVSAENVLAIAPASGDAPSWHASLVDHAARHGVQCLTPTNVNDKEVAERIVEHDPHLVLSVYYTQIFRGGVLEAIGGRALNFHPALLPHHRGNAPIIWAIVDGDPKTGLSVHHIDAGIDTGNIVLQLPLPIHPNDTGFVLHRKMANLVRAAAGELIRKVVSGEPLPVGKAQVGEASYHASTDPRVNRIVWSDPRDRIRNIVRALAPPLPGAFSSIDDAELLISRVEVVDVAGSLRPKTPGMIEPGLGETPIVWAGDGPLSLTEVVVDGARIAGSELVASGRVVEGQVLA